MSALDRINRFVVLMLENRSFDHLLGYMSRVNPAIDGMADADFNYEDPLKGKNKVPVGRATATALNFDPSHEYPEVHEQVYGPWKRARKARMSGFVSSSLKPGKKRAKEVMECFQSDQLPVLWTLASQFGVFNYWYSSMPGPTWPNRFFVHAGTCGGLTDSPGKLEAIAGYNFPNGTLYGRLDAAGKGWRIYHDDMPQAFGVFELRKYMITSRFRHFDRFHDDVQAGDLPEYTFIEPRHDPFNDFIEGNSMHPHNDVGHGEKLVKDVYEVIRGSPLWRDTMLVITFDEHGGFYDHVPPPRAVPTGDDKRYATKGRNFKFDRYGVRVPTIVVSPYTAAGTVIGKAPDGAKDVFDHASIPATVARRFGLPTLTQRDAQANTLDAALNLATARDADAPLELPEAKIPAPAPRPLRIPAAMGIRGQRMTKQQEAYLGLVMAADAQMQGATGRAALMAAPAAPRTKSAAAVYAADVQRRLLAQRSRAR